MVGHFTVRGGGDQRGVRAVAAAVGVHDLMECDHLAVLRTAHLHLGIGGVAHGGGRHFVAAVVDDLDGTVDQAGQRRGDILMVHLFAGTERAADHGAVAADIAFGNAELRGKDTAVLIGDLTRSPGMELVVAVPVGDTGDGLHRDRVLRRGAVSAFEDVIALFKAFFHVAAGADLVAIEIVLIELGVDDACTLFDRLIDRHAGGQDLVFDLDGLERAVQRFLILGNDGADAVALVQGMPGEDRLVFDQRGVLQRAGHVEVDLRNIVRCERAQNTGHLFHFGKVDRKDLRVRIGAADDTAVGHALHFQIVKILGGACHLGGGFNAADGVFHFPHLVDIHELLPSQNGRSLFHCIFNGNIACAAADVAGKAVFDLAFGRIGMLVEQLFDGKDHTGRAVAALDRAFVHQRLVDGAELLVGAEAFDRDDVRAVSLNGENMAGIHQLIVHDHGAGTAFAVIAAALSPL